MRNIAPFGMSLVLAGFGFAAHAGETRSQTLVLARCDSTNPEGKEFLARESKIVPIHNQDKHLTITRTANVITVTIEGDVPYSTTNVDVSADQHGIHYVIKGRPQPELITAPPKREDGKPVQFNHVIENADTVSGDRVFFFDRCSVARLDVFPVGHTPELIIGPQPK